MSEANFITVLFNINGKTMKIRVKTKDARKQLRVGEFRNFVFQKCRTHFTDELDNYVWKVYSKDLKKYLWANDNVLINDDDKVIAAIKENMTMLVINPNTIPGNGSEEGISRYEVEIKDRKSKRNGHNETRKVDSPPESQPVNKMPMESTQLKQHLVDLVKNRCKDEVSDAGAKSPSNSVATETPSSSPKTEVTSPRHIDIKPLLISLVKKYNQEFHWIAKSSGANSVDDDNFDGVWDLIACEMSTKLSFSNHEYTYEECKEQFGLLLNLYVSIIGMKNAKRIDDWQFFKIFHNELDLTPFDAKINDLKKKFDELSVAENKA